MDSLYRIPKQRLWDQAPVLKTFLPVSRRPRVPVLKPLGRDHRGHHHLRRPMSPCTQARCWAQHPTIPLFLGKKPLENEPASPLLLVLLHALPTGPGR